MFATLEGLLREAAGRLASAGVGEAFTDARLLLQAATGLDRAGLVCEAEARPDPAVSARLAGLLERRVAGEPVSRILGRRGFWSLDLAVTPAVLDPRADTETLVEAALVAMAGRLSEPLRILDLGTGSGAILCALLSELPQARGIGVDLSAEAAQVAQDNLAACGLGERGEIRCGSWFEPVDGLFDLIVSNPPYIPAADIIGLDAEVRLFDPALALDGGPDGLAAYRALAPGLARHLAPEGAAVLEFGLGQDGDVTAILAAAGLRIAQVRRDLAGHARAVVARPQVDA